MKDCCKSLFYTWRNGTGEFAGLAVNDAQATPSGGLRTEAQQWQVAQATLQFLLDLVLSKACDLQKHQAPFFWKEGEEKPNISAAKSSNSFVSKIMFIQLVLLIYLFL